ARDGFVLGEGGFALWIERADVSCAGGAHGDILGVAASGAAGPINAWPARPEPLVRTMQLALADAGLAPDDVDVVYASANATRGLDAIEGCALATLFGGRRTVVTSVKGALGEFGASGSAACAAAFLCGRARSGHCDVGAEASVAAFFGQVRSALGPVDILVNHAGIVRAAHILFLDTARWHEVLRVNLDAAYHCVRAVVRGMLLRRWGRIINVSSASARMPLPGQAGYAASKAALEGFTRALSRDLAAKGVLVNA